MQIIIPVFNLIPDIFFLTDEHAPAKELEEARKRQKARSPTKKKKTQQRLPAVVIGSYAASIALNKASRAPRDVDIVCTRAKLDELDAVIGAAYNADNCPLREERHKGAKIFYTFEGGARLPIEVELVSDPHTNAGHTSLDLLHWAFAAKNRKDPEWKEKEIFPGFIAICCPLRVLMAIKRSHLILDCSGKSISGIIIICEQSSRNWMMLFLQMMLWMHLSTAAEEKLRFDLVIKAKIKFI